MNEYTKAIKSMRSQNAASRIVRLYGQKDGTIVEQTTRYIRLIKKHEELFNSEEKLHIVSAPGRIEVSGNHTDHNHGKVLAAAIDKDAAACVSKRHDDIVKVYSEGYGMLEISLQDIALSEREHGSTRALIKGIASKIQELGYQIGGFEAAVHSTVLSGSGLSSSAAIENLIASIFDILYNGSRMDAMEKAKIGQYAENVYFGKPSGLLDQSASAVGGLVYMDYKHDTPEVTAKHFDFAKYGYSIIVVNTNSSHDDLTDCYAAIPKEMKAVASYFLENSLRKVRPEQVFQHIAELRDQFGERAILRTLHFFQENQRVSKLVAALDQADIRLFLDLIIESGRSSFMYLQNIYAHADIQPIALALALAESCLKDDGAWRVHGGGFAGTTLNFVPHAKIDIFRRTMESAFGEHCCLELNIRPEGAAVINIEEKVG